MQLDIPEALKNEIVLDIKELNMLDVFSEYLFERYGALQYCGYWITDDPVEALRLCRPADFDEIVQDFCDGLEREEAIIKIGNSYYDVEEVKEYVQNQYTVGL